jgi:uncharacterized protein (DUF2235 family)
MKRLALFLDGTWNEPDDNTNVTRLKDLTPDDGSEQLVKYVAGVGTRFTERIRGGALGKGLSRNVRDAYEWLVENHEENDHIFLFGFSRGAYTARTLAGMIARCGLLRPGAAMSVEEIFDRYRQGREVTPLYRLEWRVRDGDPISAEDQRLATNSHRVDIEFIGVWDTVGALGVPFGRIRGLSRSTFSFHNTFPSTLYKNMYHAIAIDEHRKAFDATLWTGFQEEGEAFEPLNADHTLEQRWFVGDHGDVGGSGSLARIPLAWIQEKAAARGMVFSESVDPPSDTILEKHGDSFATFAFGLYRIIKLNRRHRREIGRPPRVTSSKAGRSHVINETIDASVFEKWRKDSTYRPRNLAKWAAKKGASPADMMGPISA